MANVYDRRIAPPVWSAISLAVPFLPSVLEEETIKRFHALLAVPTRLGQALRELHELAVLERLIPGFKHARCLLQFNEYHKYTVDEHCIQTVECATEFIERDDLLGEIYRAIHNPSLFHLALLLHDIGKGFSEEHCIVGKRLSVETGERLLLSAEATKQLTFLVEKHLLLAHAAFRRDTSDIAIVRGLAKEIGSPELLKMLFVLTCADLAAVGPGVLTEWKISVLTDLYERTLGEMSGESAILAVRMNVLRVAVFDAFAEAGPMPAMLQNSIHAIPASFLKERHPEDFVEAFYEWQKLSPGEGIAWGKYDKFEDSFELAAVVADGAGRGNFSKMVGKLAEHGLRIHAAEIKSLPNGMLLLRFFATPGTTTETSKAIATRLADSLLEALHETTPPKFPSLWGEEMPSDKLLPTLEHRVEIDNTVAKNYTVIDFFTTEKRGLLYRIGKAIHELGLSIRIAKIGSKIDQVVYVFYVTNRNGEKIILPDRLHEIEERLLKLVQEESDT